MVTMFWNKIAKKTEMDNTIVSEFTSLYTRLSGWESKLIVLEAKLNTLEIENNDLRGNISRRLARSDKQKGEVEDSGANVANQPKVLNTFNPFGL
jgi:hypothetical protein